MERMRGFGTPRPSTYVLVVNGVHILTAMRYEGVRWIVTSIRKRNLAPEVADVAPNPAFTKFVSLP
jgi:hypothetical protein